MCRPCIAELANGNPRPIATRGPHRGLVGSGIGILGYGLALGVGCAEWVPYEQGSVLSIGRRAFPAYPASVLPPGPARNVPTPGMHRVEGSEGARRTAGGYAKHDPDPAARRAASTASRRRVGRG